MNSLRAVWGAIKPLLEQLETIKTVCDNMVPSGIVHAVAQQTAKTLASVTTMEETFRNSMKTTALLHFVSSLEEAARCLKKTADELEAMKVEAESFLDSQQ